MSRILGIDLGTSTSEIAIMEHGKAVIIPNHLGATITPSAIHIAEDGKVSIGSEAKEQILLEPENTFIEVKRLMGEDKKLSAHGTEYTPQQLSAYILRYLADCAGSYLDEEISRVVITVPAYFSDKQRQATMEAGRLCGLTVERIINEPTAAALSYGMEHLQDCANLLVYDLGGGTLDVTVLELFEGVMEVRASCGNNKLGGKDFDEAIISYILGKFSNVQRSYIEGDLRAMTRLKKEAEICKIALSREPEYTIVLPFFTEVKGRPVSVEETITKAIFEELIREQIDSTKIQINTAMKDAKMKVDEIDAILLVGGSTRIPYVRQFITETFHQPPMALVDPDLAVAGGAAIQAGIIDEEAECEALVLTDVCPYTLGTAVLRGDFFTAEELYFDPLITRNVTIPVTTEKIYSTYSTGQTAVDVEVYQGEYSDPELNNYLGQFRLSGIPPAPAGQEKIKISFSYDINGILQINATILSTGEEACLTISTNENKMEAEVDITKWKENKKSKKFASIIRRAEKEALREDDDRLFDLLRLLKTGLVKNLEIAELEEIKEQIVDYLLELEQEDE